MKARPFIKWVGGKGKLLPQLQNYYPKDLLNNNIKKYVEPFVGGGALFFEIIQKYNIDKAYISDINKDLISTYRIIQQHANELLTILEKYQKEYNNTNIDNRNDLFLSKRNEFNNLNNHIDYNIISKELIKKSALLIFLNKTCFNGLFRLNSKGLFNVPFGKYANPKIFDEQNIYAVSKILQNVDIRITNYSECYDIIDDKTFIYFDPPYKPINKSSSFTTYNGKIFDDNEQVILSKFLHKINDEKNAKIMLSNSDPKNENENDDYFDKLYKGFFINNIEASRFINCKGDKRGKIKELIITNYEI